MKNNKSDNKLTCFWLCRFGDRILSSFSFNEGEAMLAAGVLCLVQVEALEAPEKHLRPWKSRNFRGDSKSWVLSLIGDNPTCRHSNGPLRVGGAWRGSRVGYGGFSSALSPSSLLLVLLSSFGKHTSHHSRTVLPGTVQDHQLCSLTQTPETRTPSRPFSPLKKTHCRPPRSGP